MILHSIISNYTVEKKDRPIVNYLDDSLVQQDVSRLDITMQKTNV